VWPASRLTRLPRVSDRRCHSCAAVGAGLRYVGIATAGSTLPTRAVPAAPQAGPSWNQEPQEQFDEMLCVDLQTRIAPLLQHIRITGTIHGNTDCYLRAQRAARPAAHAPSLFFC
jgi:hypothetical protein